MSIRAHRINTINCEQSESFNFSQDSVLIDTLCDDNEIYGKLNSDCSGIIDISVSSLKEIIKNKRIPKENKPSIRKDIKWAKDNDEEYVQYYCF